MKIYNATNRISSALRSKLEAVLENHEECKSAYFWQPGGSASQRRRNERNRTIEPFGVQTKKGLLVIGADYSESCKHCYYRLSVTLDDESKNVRAIKALIK